MITIDIVDDNNERPAKPVVQTIPIVSSGRNEAFDAAYVTARGHYGDLLRLADQERQANNVSAPARWNVVSTLGRIARFFSAWF